MSYRMIETARRLMCEKFSILCTLEELNEKQLRNESEDDRMRGNINERIKRISDYVASLPETRPNGLRVKIKRLHPDAVIPQYAHDFDAGVDLVATEDIIVEPGETVKVPTGIAISLPPGYEAQIRPRSGITLKTKLRVQLGTVDAGYTGEIGVIVDNIAIIKPWAIDLNEKEVEYLRNYYAYTIENELFKLPMFEYGMKHEGTYIIREGDRIAQLVIAPIEQATFVEVETLDETQRGDGGFGSSGVKASYDKAVEVNGKALEKLSKEAE